MKSHFCIPWSSYVGYLLARNAKFWPLKYAIYYRRCKSRHQTHAQQIPRPFGALDNFIFPAFFQAPRTCSWPAIAPSGNHILANEQHRLNRPNKEIEEHHEN